MSAILVEFIDGKPVDRVLPVQAGMVPASDLHEHSALSGLGVEGVIRFDEPGAGVELSAG